MINNLSSRTMIFAIKVYRYFIGPLFGQHCRFHPTCSAYAIEAIEQHGALRGAWLTACRLARCQPLSEGGLDPVPSPTPIKRTRDGVNSEPSLARDGR